MAKYPFERNAEGNVVVRPVVSYAIGPIGGVSILLSIRYLDPPEGQQMAIERQIQLGLTPQAALSLAATLTKQAEGLLEPPPPEILRQ
jgi:hypothetical protein